MPSEWEGGGSSPTGLLLRRRDLLLRRRGLLLRSVLLGHVVTHGAAYDRARYAMVLAGQRRARDPAGDVALRQRRASHRQHQ